jgi:hypothetical protein
VGKEGCGLIFESRSWDCEFAAADALSFLWFGFFKLIELLATDRCFWSLCNDSSMLNAK